jgi:AraC family transcriptional regulator, arabinose operon regulatory protein
VDPRVRTATELMKRTLDRPLALDDLSKALNLSVSRLRHVFKSETGSSPSQYLKDLRLATARDLAATTFLTVKEIMVRVGIRDESHFVRDFARTYGLSPTQYRAARRADSDRSRKPAPKLVSKGR